MEYTNLKTLFYKNRSAYDKESTERPESESAVKLPLEIHGTPSYYMNCPELTSLLTDCYTKAIALQKRIGILPGVAAPFYRINCLIDEVMLSNDLEGVRSTRKEIRDIIEANKDKPDEAARLAGMVKKYLRLLEPDDKIDLSNCASIRTLYDEIVANEIAKEDQPDGEYFRKGPVSIVSATDKEKHKGVAPPEENVIQHMEQALKILQNEEIPPLIRIALFHYFFGYIHPFYDGNGRTSRFISSYLLKKDFDEMTALRLSYAIKERKSKYYEAFDVVNDKKNKGDTTPFVLAFLKIITEAQNSLIEKIDYGMEQYNYFHKIISVLAPSFDDDTMQVIFTLIQNRLFGGEALNITKLAEATNLTVYKTREAIKDVLSASGGDVIVSSKDGKKKVYSINLEQLEDFCAAQKQDK